jgi:hypothetical protein
MSGETIKEFLVGLGFEVDQGSLNKFNDGLKKATIAITAVGAAATAAAGFVAKMVTDVAKDFDAISDLGGRVNATAHEIMELGYVASLTDSSVEAVASSLDGLNRTMGEASMGMGRGKVVFEQLGISLKDANGNMKTTAAMMAEIGDTIKDLSRQEQVAILSKLGIDPTMIGALTGDVAELRAEFNQIYSDLEIDANAAAQASSDFMDSVGRLNFVFDALRKAVALKFMGQIQGGIDRMRKLLVENMPKIVNAITPIIQVILRIAEAFIAIVARIAQFAGVLIGWFNRINDATDGWAGYILAAALAWKYLNLAFLASPIGIILSLVAAIGLLIDDFMTWKEGGDSLIDWSAWEPPITAVINIVKVMADAIVNAFGYIMDIGKALMALLTGDFSGAWDALGSAGRRIVAQFGFVKDIFNEVIDVIKWLAELLFGDLSAAWEAMGAVVDKVVGGVLRAINAVRDAASAVSNFAGGVGSSVADTASSAWQGTKSFFGFGNDAAPPSAPSPQAAATLGGMNQNVSQNTEIIVQGAADPQATARAVSGQQSRVNADLTRNLAGAAR